jgi:hypothetical protein
MAGRANLVVSLVAVHKGEWRGKRMLDGNDVGVISAYFEDIYDIGEPMGLRENAKRVFEGCHFQGEGFIIANDHADRLCLADPRNRDVLRPLLNGQEVNNEPQQEPGRSIINFNNWPIEQAQSYPDAFSIVQEKVKPERDVSHEKPLRERWWVYKRTSAEAYDLIRNKHRCFGAAATTKHMNFSALPVDCVFTNTVKIFTTDRWDLYAVVQSTIHEVWARKYSGALKQDLRYSPSKCFETFAFPEGLWQTANPALATLGERYHEHRKSLMLSLWLGLTDIYNLFHARDLTPAKVAKVSKKSAEESARGYDGLLELRHIHIELDLAIRDFYGWQNLPFDHDFYELETLAENDRLRYTISPGARKELLRRLLALNHARAESEIATAKPMKLKRGKKATTPDDEHIEMFPEAS